MLNKFSLIIPTFNERENIEELIDTCEKVFMDANIDYEILVVDDNSPDKTWEIVQELSRKRIKVKLILRKEERGLSPSVIEGFNAAEGDIYGVIDADFQHPPEIITEMIKKMIKNDSDIVIASRYTQGGKIEDWNFLRRISSLAATSFSKLLLNNSLKNVTDPVSGCFIINSSIYYADNLNPKGFKILLELLAKLNINKIDEVPYSFNLRKHGESKFGSREIFIYLMQVLKLSVHTKEFLNSKVFILLGISLAVVLYLLY